MTKPKIEASAPETPLRFTYSGHLLEDLGVNLYTTMAKAFVEFVANAYDAESPTMTITFDKAQIDVARKSCKATFEKELLAAKKKNKVKDLEPLERRSLDPDVKIVLEDKGYGMTRQDLERKFLVIGRRRREEPSKPKKGGSKRLVMGRKGLGKLAAFGLAHLVEIYSRAEGENHTTRITLNYHKLTEAAGGVGSTAQSQTEIPSDKLTSKTGGLSKSGTKIVLSKLVYQSSKSADQNDIMEALARHFGFLKKSDFEIKVNGRLVQSVPKTYAYSYPEAKGTPNDQMISAYVVDEESGQKYAFSYRLRFLETGGYLPAVERGVRVYAHNRLASFPSMLGVKSSAHGFRYSDYLDGVVEADFIDNLPIDYISTDRSDLLWELHPLVDLKKLLTSEITKALGKFADLRQKQAVTEVEVDPHTKKVLDEAKLPEHRRKTAVKFAVALASSETKGVDSDYYKNTLPEIVSSLSNGAVITAIQKLSDSEKPELSDISRELTSLTKMEFDDFLKVADARVKGVLALEKIVQDVDFKKAKKERELHKLFEGSPWLINPMFFEFLLSDEEETLLASRLSKKLGVGKHVPSSYNPAVADEANPLATNKRPDLVSVLANERLERIVIVELKAPNTPLHSDHLQQLEDYIRDTEAWLQLKGSDYAKRFTVQGILIGSKSENTAKSSPKVARLEDRIKKRDRGSNWEVKDIMDVLRDVRLIHSDLLEAHNKAHKPVAKKKS